MSAVRSEWLDAVVATAERATISLTTVSALLADSIPCDQAFYVELDFGRPRAVLADLLSQHTIANADLLLTEEGMHPLTASYLVDPANRTPRRVSDLTTQRLWESTEAYADVFRPYHARFQLSMVTSLRAPVIGRGWTLTRTLHDFSERDLETATTLLPLIAVMTNRILAEGGEGVPARPLLTRQERAVLAELSKGWTASRIGFELSISERTVRKHLENAYRKLGVSDRLLATRKAAELKLI